jgi:hypothetical protein
LSPTDSCRIPEDFCTVPGLSIGWCASQCLQSCEGLFLRTKVSPEDCQTGPVPGCMQIGESRDLSTCLSSCLLITRHTSHFYFNHHHQHRSHHHHHHTTAHHNADDADHDYSQDHDQHTAPAPNC